MNKNLTKKYAFTLIELLMVIAIIGILAGILVPTVAAVKKQANIAASKAQISQYVNAMEQFKGEYGYYPRFSGSSGDYRIDLSSSGDLIDFYDTMSGRTFDGTLTIGKGNRRSIAFHSFSESEYLDGDSNTREIADRFGNKNIIIAVDGDGDGEITASQLEERSEPLKASVTAYVTEDTESDSEAYYLYEQN